MKETVQEIIGWGFPLVTIILIVLAATHRGFPGKPWLVAYLGIGLAASLAWRLPRLLLKFDTLDFDISRFYDLYGLPLNIISLVGDCMLIPFLFAVANPHPHRQGVETVTDQAETGEGSTSSHAVAQATPLFLHISVARLIVMSIVSFSLYEAYWIYRNWRYIKEREGLNIRPFWRGFFGVFFCHSLLRRIHEDKEARCVMVPSFSPGALATGWVVLLILANIVGRAPSIAASIVSAFIPSFLCLVPIQNYINTVSQRRSPGVAYYRWSSGHVVCLVFGITIWAFLLIGLGAE